MKTALLLCMLAGAVVATVAIRPDSEYEFLFEAWRNQHGKTYGSVEEYAMRLAIFSNNLDAIEAHNNAGHSWRQAANHFADMSHNEFKARYVGGYQHRHAQYSVDNSFAAVNATNLPTSVNWVNKGAVTGVKNQEQCGSCWAFSTTGSVEGITAITTGQLVSLSEQQLVDCSTANSGCSGGSMDAAFQYIINNGGICSEQAYPYTAQDGTCKSSQCQSVASITGYNNVPTNSESALMAAVAQQPVSIAIQANQAGFQFYSGGVFTGTCGTQLDHGVLAVGYGTSSGQDYWLVKNSWGATWGMSGYIELGRGSQFAPHGQCGLLMDPSVPTKN